MIPWSPPYFVVSRDDGGVTLCETLEAAVTEMEAPDVESGVFAVFDAAGLTFVPSVRDGRVHITEAVPLEYRSDELLQAIKAQLTRRTAQLKRRADGYANYLKDLGEAGIAKLDLPNAVAVMRHLKTLRTRRA